MSKILITGGAGLDESLDETVRWYANKFSR